MFILKFSCAVQLAPASFTLEFVSGLALIWYFICVCTSKSVCVCVFVGGEGGGGVLWKHWEGGRAVGQREAGGRKGKVAAAAAGGQAAQPSGKVLKRKKRALHRPPARLEATDEGQVDHGRLRPRFVDSGGATLGLVGQRDLL